MSPSRRRTFLLAAVLPLALAGVSCAQTPAMHATAKPRLLIHVSENEPARWNMALGNAKNAQDDVGGPDKIDIEIVSNGPAVLLLKNGSPIAAGVAHAQSTGVKIVACETAMRLLKVEKRDMLPTVAYVPAGIIELTRKQQEGWAYVRP